MVEMRWGLSIIVMMGWGVGGVDDLRQKCNEKVNVGRVKDIKEMI